jgi:hypothetical protein
VCEGFATGCSIQEAFPDVPTIVSFDCHNLFYAMMSIREINFQCKIVICADNDPAGTGEKYANEAAMKIGNNVHVILPHFENNESGSDYNDLHMLKSIEEVRKQIKRSCETENPIQFLGMRDNNFYYTSTKNKQIVPITGGQHNKQNFRTLMPDEDWMKFFPACRTDEGKVIWDRIENFCKAQSFDKGPLIINKIKGSGVWEDRGVLVLNDGNAALGFKQSILIPDSRFSYIWGKPFGPKNNETLSNEEFLFLEKIFSLIPFSEKSAQIKLFGWIIAAPFSGILQWRPHIWVTGPSSSGKSFVFDKIVSPILAHFSMKATGASTEAGIRQMIKSDAVPVVFDEFETDDVRTSERVQSLIELMRQASSGGDGVIIKGTQNGQAIIFKPHICALVASIRVSLRHGADMNRFSVLELDPKIIETKARFKSLNQEIMNKDLVNIGDKVFNTFFYNIENFKKN